MVVCMVSMFCLTINADVKEANYQVIPLPQKITQVQGSPFLLTPATRIIVTKNSKQLLHEAKFLAGYIYQATGFKPTVSLDNHQSFHHSIILTLDNSIKESDGYLLVVSSNTISIKGNSAAGVFYGVQTLRKSIPAVSSGCTISFPSTIIRDYPRFSYRGMHLDCCRHFFSTDEVKRYIDLLTLHNMNVFHWHLSDDQGWRIEIKKYPRLTTVGSKRSCTIANFSKNIYDSIPYGGFYTQDEIRQIVAYAKARHITIIPEIDMPGHMLAALASYPELGCTGGPYAVGTTWGVFNDVLCVGKDNTFKFVRGVLDEVMSLFPSKLIHIGGDEVPRDRWKACPSCQKRIADEGLKADSKFSAEDHLQSYFMARIEKYLNSKGRSIIGWDEILDGDVSPNATVMSWRGSQGGETAARLKHHVIMTPVDYAYFDYYQIEDRTKDSVSFGACITVEKVYKAEPIPVSLSPSESKYILGVQGNLWSEYIPSAANLEFKVLPRMSAMSELQWTEPERKNYDDFISRLPRLMEFFKRDGYHFATYVLQR